MLKKIFRRSAPVETVRGASGPDGYRAYAIGDVHGRADLLDLLLARIAEEEERRPRCDTFLIFLGDLIDRGEDSCGVVDRLIDTDWDYVKPVFLMGNHEEMMVRALRDEPELVNPWLVNGGYECAQSYGVPVGEIATLSPTGAADLIRAHIPPAHLEFLAGFHDSFRFGDYLFVHAGIRRGVPVDQQDLRDLRWIRADFIDDETDDGIVVVHGHTIAAEPDQRANRIGIDTGAYMGGALTAIVIEGGRRDFLSVTDHDLPARIAEAVH